jgi:hypothetical protein
MRRLATWFLGILVLALAVGGCQRFKTENTIQLEYAGVHRIDVDAPNHNQDLKVETDSNGVEIDVYVVLGEKNADAVARKLIQHHDPDKAMVLASECRAKTATVLATIPAKQTFAIFLAWPNENTYVKYTISGR